MKGISPLIASVLLIAFTVAVAGILSTWITGFTRQSTETVESESTTQLTCTYGGISLSGLKFNTTSNALTGQITNTGTIGLGNIKLQVVYTNKTTMTSVLCQIRSSALNCSDTSTSNITMTPGQVLSFSITGSSSYEYIYATTNCSSVRDKADTGDVSSTS